MPASAGSGERDFLAGSAHRRIGEIRFVHRGSLERVQQLPDQVVAPQRHGVPIGPRSHPGQLEALRRRTGDHDAREEGPGGPTQLLDAGRPVRADRGEDDCLGEERQRLEHLVEALPLKAAKQDPVRVGLGEGEQLDETLGDGPGAFGRVGDIEEEGGPRGREFEAPPPLDRAEALSDFLLRDRPVDGLGEQVRRRHRKGDVARLEVSQEGNLDREEFAMRRHKVHLLAVGRQHTIAQPELLVESPDRNAERTRDPGDLSERFLLGFADEEAHPRMHDAGLLAGHVSERRAQNLRVLELDRRDDADLGPEHVGRVQSAPRPTSITAASTCSRANHSKASAVVTSKNVGGRGMRPEPARDTARLRIRSIPWTTAPGSIGVRSI